MDAENMERKPNYGTVCHLHTVFFSMKSKMIDFEGTLKRRDFPSVGLAPKELLSFFWDVRNRDGTCQRAGLSR